MLTSGEQQSDAPPGPPLYDLLPDRGRVDRIDAVLRRRLIDSLDHIRDSGAAPAAIDWSAGDLRTRLDSGPVSAWVFGLYSKFVADLSGDRGEDAAGDFDDILRASARPAGDGVIGLDDARVPPAWWEHFKVLLDTDPRRPFRPVAPRAADVSSCAADIQEALDVLEAADPAFHEETRALLRTVVLGAPGSPEPDGAFNGASTFFMWGAALLNAAVARSPIQMLDVLIHEASHVLLFGIGAGGALTRNAGGERYSSPLRSDQRPVDGIFHACFVTTRVHLALGRLLDSGRLGRDDERQALERRRENAGAARSSLDVLDQRATPTPLGEAVLDTLRGYWAENPLD